jgi:hypothetical protein
MQGLFKYMCGVWQACLELISTSANVGSNGVLTQAPTLVFELNFAFWTSAQKTSKFCLQDVPI